MLRGLADRIRRAGYCLGQELPDEHFPRFHPVPTQPAFRNRDSEVLPPRVDASGEGWKASDRREANPTPAGATWIFRAIPFASEGPHQRVFAEAQSEPTATLR